MTDATDAQREAATKIFNKIAGAVDGTNDSGKLLNLSRSFYLVSAGLTGTQPVDPSIAANEIPN
jgi:hypothetical protein